MECPVSRAQRHSQLPLYIIALEFTEPRNSARKKDLARSALGTASTNNILLRAILPTSKGIGILTHLGEMSTFYGKEYRKSFELLFCEEKLNQVADVKF